MLSLQDVLAMPNDPDPEHLRRMGLLPPAPQNPTPSVIPPVGGTSGVQVPQMSAVIPKPAPETTTVTADAPKPEAVKPMTAPAEVGELQPPNADLSKSPKKSLMSFPSREEARRQGEDLNAPASAPPLIPEIGSKAGENVELDRLRDEKLHPWGTPENHPGLLGKIGHVAAKIGNIAGDIVAPTVMENIPGTELNKRVEEHVAEKVRGAAETRESETALHTAEQRNVESETKKRDEENKQTLTKDAQDNVVGWQDEKGTQHSMDDPATPQSIKDIAEQSKNKEAGPKFEKDENGNIVALSVDKDGKTTSEVVYHGDPKLESDLVHGHLVNGVTHALLVNKKTGETIKDLGAERQPSQTAAQEHGIEVVRATDKDGKVHLMSQDDAKKAGFTHITKASDADIDKAKTHTVTLNDMQAKLNDVVSSRKALDQDKTQRVIIARLLSSIDKFKTVQDLTNAAVSSGATPLTQDYVISVKSLRESSLGLPKEITSGSRVSELQGSALWQTLPDAASLNGEYALKQSKKFQANIDRLRERPEIVEGMSVTSPHGDLAENKPGEPPKPPAGKTVVYDPQGVAHFALSSKIGEMLKDPKYKGWSQSAPSSSH